MADSKELLTKISDVSTESEFFSPMPKNYKPGKTRYVFVMGTVMSGLGKGIFSSCLAKLLQDKGLKVAPIKRVVSLHDSASIYMIPSMLREHMLDWQKEAGQRHQRSTTAST